MPWNYQKWEYRLKASHVFNLPGLKFSVFLFDPKPTNLALSNEKKANDLIDDNQKYISYFEFDNSWNYVQVNNAGVNGVAEDAAAPEGALSKWNKTLIQNYEMTVQCLQTNYYGAKRMIDAFIPLLQLSESPRIVNVSSTFGQLENVSNKWAIGIFSDAKNLSEERVDEVLNVFLKDFKEDSLLAKGWPAYPAYIISKAALNAYTRVLAKKYPTFCINCVCPGYVKTDINYNTGSLSVEEGAATPVKLALLPDGAPSGFFFQHGDIILF